MNEAVAMRPDLGGENFECPEGIKFVEIDSMTGLRSTLGCPLRELIAVTERLQPNMECYLHGNLPPQSSPFAEESEMRTETTLAKKEPPSSLRYGGTRVDVDANGRRTLVNDMR
jgi:hypothetical protein